MHSTEGTVNPTAPTTEQVEAAPEVAATPAATGGQGAHGGDVHLPPPSIYPFTTAAGVAIAGLGVVTTFAISWLGLAIMIWGLWGWVQELRHEHH